VFNGRNVTFRAYEEKSEKSYMAYSFVTTNLPAFDGNSASSDCRLFTAIKQGLGDHKFKKDRWVETAVPTRWLITQDNDWHQQNRIIVRDNMSENNVAVTACRNSGVTLQCGRDSVQK
jgi:hypothetical protein